jgi:hypothetical protein
MNVALPSYLTSIHSFGNRMSTDLPPKTGVTNDIRFWDGPCAGWCVKPLNAASIWPLTFR